MYVSVTSGPAIEISSGIHALEEARVTIENSALGAEKGMFFCNFANYSAHLLLPQADEPRICYCLREQDSNLPRIALLFLIPISHLVPLLEFNLYRQSPSDHPSSLLFSTLTDASAS